MCCFEFLRKAAKSELEPKCSHPSVRPVGTPPSVPTRLSDRWGRHPPFPPVCATGGNSPAKTQMFNFLRRFSNNTFTITRNWLPPGEDFRERKSYRHIPGARFLSTGPSRGRAGLRSSEQLLQGFPHLAWPRCAFAELVCTSLHLHCMITKPIIAFMYTFIAALQCVYDSTLLFGFLCFLLEYNTAGAHGTSERDVTCLFYWG